jgi:hypothetical protein
MLISQKGDPMSAEGMSRVEPIRIAAEEALKGTPLENSKVFLTGTAVQALTVSSDNLTGQLSDATGSELAASTSLDSELGIIAFVDRA